MGLGIALGLLAGAEPAKAARYTLDALLAKVKSEYPGVRAAEESLNAAKAQLGQAQRLWVPSGDVNFWITGAPKVQCQGPGPGFASSPDKITRETNCVTTNVTDLLHTGNDFLDAAPIRGVALGLSVNVLQPLYTFGKIESANGAAKAGVEAAKGGLELARADVVFNAIRAYWGLKWSRASIATLEEGIDKLRDWTGRIDAAISGANPQKYTEGDLARLKIALENAELVRIDIQRGVKLAIAAMRVLTGDPEADVDEEEIEVLERSPKPLSFYEDAALTHRPEAKQLEAAVFAAKNWRRLKLADMLPDFGLLTNFNYTYASSVDNPANAFMNHSNGLGFGLVLVAKTSLEFGVRSGRYAQAAADERAIAQRRIQALGGIALEIDKAYADLEEARERANRTNHGEKVARGWYNAVDQSLQAGLYTDGRELTDAARNYFEFRLRHLSAIMDANIALGWLYRTSGIE